MEKLVNKPRIKLQMLNVSIQDVCPICNNILPLRLIAVTLDHLYFRCNNCRMHMNFNTETELYRVYDLSKFHGVPIT